MAQSLRLTALAGIALALGLLVYAADRDPARVLLFPALAALRTGPLFGAAGSWLPSFVHPFAFSLLTAAALSPATRPAYGACAAWWAVNIGFEIAQHARLSGAFAEALHGVLGPSVVTDALANYVLRGSFDPADIVAATVGALAAAGVLALLHRHHHRIGSRHGH